MGLIDYSEQYILSSFPKKDIAVKLKFIDNLYLLLQNLFYANNNIGSIRKKYQKDMMVNINFLDYFIEIIKIKNIISAKRFMSFINKLNDINKLVNGWVKSEAIR